MRQRKIDVLEKQRVSYPDRATAARLLLEGGSKNPGPWVAHSRFVAQAAERIARHCPDLDADAAYVCGLLHDIGRQDGGRGIAHVYDGYHFLKKRGCDLPARIALTHSFSLKKLSDYIGEIDISPAQYAELESLLAATSFDDYDYLIQLCDSLATADGIVTVEERMEDVRRRYGSYPQDKWNRTLELKAYFEQKTGMPLQKILED